MKRITIKEAPHKRAICETKMRYDVFLDGKLFSELYYNMRGYCGSLPCKSSNDPDKIVSLCIGETSISNYKKEIAKLNRELAV